MCALVTLPAVILDSLPVSLHIEILLSIAKLRSLTSWDHLFKLLLGGYRNGADKCSDHRRRDTMSYILDVSAPHLIKSCSTDLKPPPTFYNELNLGPSTALKILENKAMLLLVTSALYIHPYEYGMKYCSKKKSTYSR